MHIDFVIPVNGNLTAGLESYKHKAEKAAMDKATSLGVLVADNFTLSLKNSSTLRANLTFG